MIKNPPEKIETEKVFHIYAKNRCLYHNLDLEDFKEKWEMLNVMVGLLKTDYQEEDLDYIAVEGTPTDGMEVSY